MGWLPARFAFISALLTICLCASVASARAHHSVTTVFNFRHGCIPRQPDGYTALARDGDPYEVLATAATRSRARGLLDVLRAHRIYSTWEHDFSLGGHSAHVLGPGDGRPFEIFVVPHQNRFFTQTGSDGADLELCNSRGDADPHHDAILAADNLSAEPSSSGPIDWSVNVLAHELFHAFQGGVMGHYPDAGAWWLEATAEWGADDLFSVPASRVSDLDESLFDHPELPLDYVARSGPAYERHHPYAVWRFLQWLNTDFTVQHASIFPYLVDTFRALGGGTSPYRAVVDGFPSGVEDDGAPAGAAGFELALADFWQYHLTPELPSWVKGRPVALTDNVGVGPGGLSDWSATAPSLGLATVDLSAPGVNLVYVDDGVMPGDDWLDTYGCAREAIYGDTGSSDPEELSLSRLEVNPSTEEIRMAFVNGESTPASIRLELEGSTPDSAPDPDC